MRLSKCVHFKHGATVANPAFPEQILLLSSLTSLTSLASFLLSVKSLAALLISFADQCPLRARGPRLPRRRACSRHRQARPPARLEPDGLYGNVKGYVARSGMEWEVLGSQTMAGAFWEVSLELE